MRANIIYIFILLVALVAVFIFANGLQGRKQFNDKVTLRKNDKIPYGTNVAFRALSLLFPEARVFTRRQEPGYWDSISMHRGNQAFICITREFNPDEFEMKKLIAFAEAGNDVLVSAFYFSEAAEKYLFVENNARVEFPDVYNNDDDSLTIRILKPSEKTYSYPGANNGHTFHRLNMDKALVLGDEEGAPNFIHLQAGKGNFFVHRSPMAFTNYFLLHKQNMGYFESVMSLFSPRIEKILWDEYYITKRQNREERKKGWFSVLMQYPGLSTAIITAMLTLLVYALAEMRRKQRMIPVIAKPQNDSLDFVRTIGRLYYEKGDHRNLARKMSSYFLEYVRTRYKLPTVQMDESFINSLQYKSGVEGGLIREIVTSIRYFEDAPHTTAGELNAFYRRLETFYQKA